MILLYLLVPAAYLVAALPEWQRLAHPALPRSPAAGAIARWVPALALAGHAVLVASTVFARDGLDLSLVNATSAVAGLAALFAWAVGLGGHRVRAHRLRTADRRRAAGGRPAGARAPASQRFTGPCRRYAPPTAN